MGMHRGHIEGNVGNMLGTSSFKSNMFILVLQEIGVKYSNQMMMISLNTCSFFLKSKPSNILFIPLQ